MIASPGEVGSGTRQPMSMAAKATSTFGQLLRQYRATAGLTQEELAERAGERPRHRRSGARGACGCPPGDGAAARGRVAARRNLLGILDLANAFLLSILTVQGQLPFPFVLIPSFVVPLSVLLHAVSLRQLRRVALSVKQTKQPVKASTAGLPYSPPIPAN
jgi:hypothetical protein